MVLGGGALTPAPVYKQRGLGWPWGAGTAQTLGLYSDQVARWVEPGSQDRPHPLGVFYANRVSVSGVCDCGALRNVKLRADPCRSLSLWLVLKTAEAWICGRRGLFCLS